MAFEGRTLISESGFESFPYMVSRYVTAPREVYGRSPAMLALPDIKMINEMSDTRLPDIDRPDHVTLFSGGPNRRRERKVTRPRVGHIGPSWALRRLPDASASRHAPCLPEETDLPPSDRSLSGGLGMRR